MAFPVTYTPSGGPIAAAANPGFAQLVAAGLVDITGNVWSVNSSNLLNSATASGYSGTLASASTTVSSIQTIKMTYNGSSINFMSRISGGTNYSAVVGPSSVQFYGGSGVGLAGGVFSYPTLFTTGVYIFTFVTKQLNSSTTFLSISASDISGNVVFSAQQVDSTSASNNVTGTCGLQVQNSNGSNAGIYYYNISTTIPENPTVLPYVANPSSNAVQVLIDSDLSGDCDDVGDIGLCCAMQRAGVVNLLGIVVTNIEPYGASCANALVKYGLPGSNIPIAQYNGSVNTLESTSPYNKQITQAYGVQGDVASNYQSHITLYRKIFAASADNSIVLIVTGSITSFVEFLQSSADGISTRTGIQLAQQKLKIIHFEAGWFPSSAATGDAVDGTLNNTAEYNIQIDIPNSRLFLTMMSTYLPNVQVYWVGDEVGFNYGLGTAFPLSHGTYSPFNLAYQFKLNSAVAALRPPWGQASVNFAVYGVKLFAPVGYNGTITIDSSGKNNFLPTLGQHSYLMPIAATQTINASMNQDLIMAAPVSNQEIVQVGSGASSSPSIASAGTTYPASVPIAKLINGPATALVNYTVPATGVPGSTGTVQSARVTFSIAQAGATEFCNLLDRMTSDGRAVIS